MLLLNPKQYSYVPPFDSVNENGTKVVPDQVLSTGHTFVLPYWSKKIFQKNFSYFIKQISQYAIKCMYKH